MTGRVFLDTNVLVYLFDRGTPGKQQQARRTLTDVGRSAVISTQVLQEFYVVVTRKLGRPLSVREADAAVSDLAELDVVIVDVALIRAAIATSRDHRLSFWDGLVIDSARAKGCTRLLSEDLQHGRTFGEMTIENPFLSVK